MENSIFVDKVKIVKAMYWKGVLLRDLGDSAHLSIFREILIPLQNNNERQKSIKVQEYLQSPN